MTLWGDIQPWIAANYFTDWTAKGASDRLLMSLQVDTMRKHCPKTCARWDRIQDALEKLKKAQQATAERATGKE